MSDASVSPCLRGQSPARILVVEDELPMRTALEDCLAGEGFRVITAADGERGLERALKEKPDLILLDVMMPRLDGFAVCAELRRLGHAGRCSCSRPRVRCATA